VLPAVPAEAMSVFLAEVSRPHAGELMVLVLAGAGGHQAKRRQGPCHDALAVLTPWSPPLNPLEHLGDEGREKGFANRVFARRKAVEKQLITALKTLQEEPTRGASLTGFAWISSTPLNAH
jgi:hypothetical protein